MNCHTITLATILISGISILSVFGDNEQLHSTDTTPHQVSIVSAGETTVIPAEVIWIDMGNGTRISIAVRDIIDGQVPIFAGNYPTEPEATSWHSLVLYPGAANVIRIGVEEHKKQENE